MAPFTHKYSHEQRVAIIEAVLKDGLSVLAAVEAAATGELGPEPFTIPRTTAHSIIAKEIRDTRSPMTMCEELSHRLVKLCAREIGRLEELDALGPQDVRALLTLAKMLPMLRALTEPQAGPNEPDADDHEDENDDAGGLVSQLAAQHEHTQGNGHHPLYT